MSTKGLSKCRLCSSRNQLMLDLGRRRDSFSKTFNKLPDGNMMNMVKMTFRTIVLATWK